MRAKMPEVRSVWHTNRDAGEGMSQGQGNFRESDPALR